MAEEPKGQKTKLPLHETEDPQLRKKRVEITKASAPANPAPTILPIDNPAQREPPKAISGPEAQPVGTAAIPNVPSPPEPEPPNVAVAVAESKMGKGKGVKTKTSKGRSQQANQRQGAHRR